MLEFNLIFRLALYSVLVFAAINDVRRMNIPNSVPIAAFVIFLAALFYQLFFIDGLTLLKTADYLIGGLLAFGIGLALFVMGVMGGGDSKLFAVLGFWFGVSGLLQTAIIISLTGVFVAAVYAAIFAAKHFMKPNNENLNDAVATRATVDQSFFQQAMRLPIPYGVAICIGAIISGELALRVAF